MNRVRPVTAFRPPALTFSVLAGRDWDTDTRDCFSDVPHAATNAQADPVANEIALVSPIEVSLAEDCLRIPSNMFCAD